jgi:hypothetical protein
MYRFFTKLFTFLSVCLLITSCNSGKKALQRGDYFTAVMTSVERLRTNPEHKKSRETLQESYRLAVDWSDKLAKNTIASSAPNKYKTALFEYEKINRMYEAIGRSPGATRVIRYPVEKYKEVNELKSLAAAESYEAGIVAMMNNNRADAKRAYFLFREANNFVPGYAEAIEMMAQAEYNATLRVVFEENNFSYQGYSLQPAILNATNDQFIKFFSTSQAENEAFDFADHFLYVTISSMQPGTERIKSEVRTVSDSVTTGEKEVKGVKIPIKEKVEAEFTTHIKQISATGQARITIQDAKSQATLLTRDVNSVFEWTDSWATVKGDQRALNDAQKKLVAKREPRISTNDLMRGLQNDMDRKVIAELRDFYSRY